jgi:hypothetical protein
MLHVMNDDNNDELFRLAAQNYPLKTDSSDWAAVQDKMNTSVPEPKNKISRIRNYWPLLLLLLFIPLKMYETKFVAGNNRTVGKNVSVIKPAALSKQQEQAGTNPETALPGNQPVLSVNEAGNISGRVQSTPGISIAKEKFFPGNDKINHDDNNEQHNPAHRPSLVSKQKTNAFVKNVLPEEDIQDKKFIDGTDDPSSKTQSKSTEPITATTLNDPNAKQTDTNKDKEVIKKDIKQTDPKTTTSKVSTDKKNKSHVKHFYIGLAAGPDFSTIKLQSVKKTGLNYGFVAGYRIGKRISIETGLFKDRKFYSTDGKYFNTKEIYLPTNAKIEYVDGECNMLELPINIHYTFFQRPRSGLFAAAGFSSYFMKNESYLYDINHNGVRYPRSGEYDEKSNTLVAVINISAGYTYKLGKICDLRVEPYVKLPVNKIGTGHLPLQSAGIMVGITKTIF